MRGMSREPIATPCPLQCMIEPTRYPEPLSMPQKIPGVRGSAPHKPWNNPQTYDPSGTKTRHQPGNPAKITRPQLSNHERYQFGI